jgi:Ca-activated chloride channel family protein
LNLALDSGGWRESAAEVGLALGPDWGLADPWFLSTLPLAILLVVTGRGRRGRARLTLPGLAAGRPPRSLRQRLAAAVPWFTGTALCLFGLALARPLRVNVDTNETTAGVDILAVVDRSSSMREQDLAPGRTRLDVALEVLGEFAVRRMTDRVGAADSVGLLIFARYPELLCPFTLDADAFLEFVRGVEVVRYRGEDGTAIGVALAKAVSVLDESEAKSKVAVLLTDGENGIPDITPLEAAALAAASGVRVYTVFAAAEGPRAGAFGLLAPPPADTSELEAIAEQTGGRFYRARDRDSLEQIYAEIETLERTPRERWNQVQTFDLYPWFLGSGLAVQLLGLLLGATVARRTP